MSDTVNNITIIIKIQDKNRRVYSREIETAKDLDREVLQFYMNKALFEISQEINKDFLV